MPDGPVALPARMVHRSQHSARDIGLDVLRAFATFRVFLWHATGWAMSTYIGAIPVMFFITGMLLHTTLEHRGALRTMLDRARRVLLPYWAFAVVMLSVMTMLGPDGSARILLAEFPRWILPLQAPTGVEFQQGWITEPLWYLRTYCWLILALPLLSTLRRRIPIVLPVLLALGVVAFEALVGSTWWAIQDFMLYGAFLTAGLSFTSLCASPSRRLLIALAVVTAAAAVASYTLHPPLDGVVNNSHTLHLLVGAATLCVALATLPMLRLVGSRRGCAAAVSFTTRHSLSIYLWHPPVLGAVWVAVSRLGLMPSVLTTAIALSIGATCTVVLVRVVGRAESYAARRQVAVPSFREVAQPAVLLAMLAATLALPTPTTVQLPPTPSRAPTPAVFAITADALDLIPPDRGPYSSPNTARTPDTDLSPRPTESTTPPASSATSSKQQTSPPSKPTTWDTTPATLAPPTSLPLPSRVAGLDTLSPPLTPGQTAGVEELLTAFTATRKTGVDVVLLAPNRYAYAASFDASGTPRQLPSSVPIYSVTKSFSGALLLRAIEEGRIGLDEPIGPLDAAPWFTKIASMTPATLLAHRSGLVNYTETKAFRTDWRSIDGWEPALRAVEAESLRFAPGTHQEYSSTNYIVVGLLVAQIYGAPIEQLITDTLLTPIGLNNTSVSAPTPGSPGTGTGNMYASLPDLARWAVAMWRDATVLGPIGNPLAAWTDPKTLIGYGSFSFCPCVQRKGTTVSSAIGMNGVSLSVRYYTALDVVLVLRTDTEQTTALDALATDLVSYLR